MDFSDDIYTAYTVSSGATKFAKTKVDESKLPQPGEIIKIRDQHGRVRLCQVQSFKLISDADEWVADYEFVLVLLPTGITFPMRASSEYWALMERATDLEGLASADDS